MPVWLIQILVGIALELAGSLLSGQAQQSQPKSGIEGSLTLGGDNPLSFIVGRFGTAGQLEYAGTWGNDGDTPNAYLTHVISVSDLPCRGLAGLFVDGVKVTIDGTHAAFGYPVTEYRKGSTDHLWIEFFDGTQTVVDTVLLDKFGSDATRPWQDDMIGRGITYARVTALINRNLFNAIPDYFFEVDGITLDDPRGDDAQDNPVVAIQNILSGLSYGGDWFWGPQGIPATRLPSAVWQAQMDKCDAAVALAAGGTEKRFRAGAEITVDKQPADVIQSLLDACNGRIAEIGGIYKLLVAEPDDPVLSFTDDDIAITESQTFDPFPGLESTYNGVTATYPEPTQKWASNTAPPLIDTDLEAADDSRRLPASIDFGYVPFALQVQRLMQALHLEDRRFRAHTQTMPPAWWEFEVLDTVSWTSTRNSYTGKVFLITTMDDLPTGNQFIGLKEQDPSDYTSWSTEDEKPVSTAPLSLALPAPQLMTGWTAVPATMVDPDGNGWLPSIRAGFASGLADVRAVRIQVRESWGSLNVVFDGEVAYDPDAVSPSVLINAAFVPNKAYQVRGIFEPFSGRVTRWSNQDSDGTDGDWLTVTTPNVSMLPPGSVALVSLANDITNWMSSTAGGVRALIDQFNEIGTTLDAADQSHYEQRQALSRSIDVKLGNLEASFNEVIEVALGPGGAIATALESLYAAVGGNTAQVNIRWQSVAAPAGYAARYAIQCAVNDGSFRSATLFIDVPADPSQPTRIGLEAGQTVFFTSDGTPLALIGEDGVFRSANGVVELDMIGGAFSITVP